MALAGAALVTGCEAFVDDLDDVTWVSGSVGGPAGVGGNEGPGPQGGGGQGADSAGTGGSGDGCTAPPWSGVASKGGGGYPGCGTPPAPPLAGEFGGCPDCVLTDSTLDVSFDDGWAPFCAYLRGEDPAGDIRIESGAAILSSACSIWGASDYGPFLYRRVALNDFVVVTHLRVSDGASDKPATYGHGAGLILRSTSTTPPDQGDEFLRLSVAYELGAGVGVFSWRKLASGGWQDLPEAESDHLEHDLALCRKDGMLEAWYRPLGGSWNPLGAPLDDGNLAAEVQAGVEVHAYQGGAKVEATFGALLYARVEASQSCQATLLAMDAQLRASQK